MTGKRKRYGAEFKARVALEALRGELTAARLATKHGIHHTMVGEWKKQAMEGPVSVFSGKEAAQDVARLPEAETARLINSGQASTPPQVSNTSMSEIEEKLGANATVVPRPSAADARQQGPTKQ